MDDLISRSKLMKDKVWFFAAFVGDEYAEGYIDALYKVAEAINEQSTVDAVPVVRCKDCGLIQSCKNAQYLGLEGYCSNGEDGKKVQE